LITAVVAFVAFAAVLPGGKFVFDDHVLIEHNTDLLRHDIWWTAFGRDYYATSQQRGDTGYYRPLAVLANAADLKIHHFNKAGFHLTNLLLHAAASVALAPALMGVGIPSTVAWVTAVFFAAHPVHAESVAFVSGRVDVLAGLFCFVALGLVNSRRRFATAGVGLAAFAAFVSKEIAVVLPLLLLIAWMARADVLRLAGFDEDFERPRGLSLLVAVGVAAMVALLLRFASLGGLLPVSASGPRGSWLLPLQTVWFALAALYAPLRRLMLEPSPERLSFGWLAAGLVVAAGMWVAAARLERSLRPALWRCAVAGGVALLPILNLLPQETLLSERFLYIASGFWLVPAGVLLVAAWQRSRSFQPLVLGAGLVVLLLLGGISAWRARAWRDDVVLWRLAVREEPNRAPYWDRLGLALTERKDFAPAEEALQRAIALDPNYFNAQLNMGVLMQTGGHAHEAVKAYRHAIELQPRHVNAHLNLGMALLEIGDLKGAHDEFKTAVALKPDNPDAQRLLGGAALQMGQLVEARTALETARRLVPNHPGIEQAYKVLQEMEQRRAAQKDGAPAP
jgi:tetratricopeptide (TPR) repeat protein